MPRSSATSHELARVELLAGLPGQVLGKLAKEMTREELPPGTVVMREGEEGDRFYVETVTHLKQQLKAMGQPFNQNLEQTSVLGFTVKKNADTSTVLEEKIEALKFKADPGAVAVPDDKVIEKLQGLTLLITLSARGEVTNLEGHKELIKKLTADDAGTRKLVGELSRYLEMVPAG